MNSLNERKINTQLAAARSVIAQSGKSPRQIGQESLLKLFAWIYLWGYITPFVCRLLLNRTAGGYLQKLVKQMWLVETKTESGTPKSYFTLSESGLQEAERYSSTLVKYVEINQFKVDQLKIRHNC